ncbi:DUF4178 domain-containing protein [Achromobacter xylosoxidans]
MQQVLCPQCGAPVSFTSAASVMAVCGACRSTLLKDAASVRRIGEAVEVLEDYSPICLGAVGKYESKRFDVVDRIQMRYDDGFWNEWYLWFEDGSDGWLSDASGQYAVTRRRRAKTAGEMPAFDQIKPGFFFKLDGQNYVASDIRTCAVGGTQGELPFVADGGWQAKVADFRSLDAFLTLDYSDGPDPELYIVARVRAVRHAGRLAAQRRSGARDGGPVPRPDQGAGLPQLRRLHQLRGGDGHPGGVPVLWLYRGLRRREGRGHREGAQAQVHQDHAGAGRDGQHRRRRLQPDRPDEMRGPGSRGAVAMDRIPDVQPGPGLSVAGRDR